jgi:hypothetical protein
MAPNNLDDELRNLRFNHLNASELAAYCDHELDETRRALAEAHLKQCFICERQLALLREESDALNARKSDAADVALVRQVMEQMSLAPKPLVADPGEISKESLQERLTEYLRQMVASWRICFGHGALRSGTDQGEEVWRWQSEDEKVRARATIEKNADLTIHFSSNEMELEGARLSIRLGAMNQEITLRRVSESEVDAKVAVPWPQRPRNMADISIEASNDDERDGSRR